MRLVGFRLPLGITVELVVNLMARSRVRNKSIQGSDGRGDVDVGVVGEQGADIRQSGLLIDVAIVPGQQASPEPFKGRMAQQFAQCALRRQRSAGYGACSLRRRSCRPAPRGGA